MNAVFLAIVLTAFAVAAFRQITWTGGAEEAPMSVLGTSMIDAAAGSVTLAIGLVGVMALFLGLMKVAEQGGLLVIIAKTLRPLLIRLFPDVPAEHPAMGAMILNMAANVLGLGNAATPFGIRAMQQLEALNPLKGTASNSMALFLAINTSSITILPTGVIALRAAAGSVDPAGIVPTTLFATICSTTVAIIACKFLEKRWRSPPADPDQAAEDSVIPATDDFSDVPKAPAGAGGAYPIWVSVAALAGVAALVPLTVFHGRAVAPWIIPGLMVGLLSFGALRGVSVYEAFVEGAKDGFNVALRIIPYLVAILVAVGMFRASGAMALIIQPLGAITELVGLPPDALPMALLRPLSGSGAYGILASIIQNPAIGPDSYVGYLVSTFQGSTETTFYVLAVYFGAVGIRRIRHALVAALLADLAGICGAVFIVSYLYG
ncbi:MAG: spore maturation protein [Rhodospirillaceae bacterium]|nr:spore maturation protein [Rhodospirillaceae bacterium]MBT5299437.1 spore maturation protein [Rhodospirillaceae bacterium]MBT5514707.1 spore maturation protein [Rhodospirillaceae bacterium]MBT6085474.1 spore maturation protein [Rhodospirillaceae bacterium]